MLRDRYTIVMAALTITNIQKKFGPTPVLQDVSLSVEDGQFYFILGASGCGKSTLLRIIAGLETADSGSIESHGQRIDAVPAHQRGIGMVFQQYALWPHMTVGQNIAFGLEVQGLPRRERDARVAEALTLVRMAGLERRYPHEISGGQQQRVALARALAVRPSILLLDEPLSNLDARLREEIREELQNLHRTLKITMVYVTHDQEDALTLGDRIALLRGGRVEQVGTPRELYETPRTDYVAEFLGRANLISCSLGKSTSADQVTVTLPGQSHAPLSSRLAPGTTGPDYLLCVRPESIRVSSSPQVSEGLIDATVRSVSYRGAFIDIDCTTTLDERLFARVLSSEAPRDLSIGASVGLSWDARATVVVSRSNPVSQ